MWPTHPSHYPPPPKKGDLISSLLLQYHSNPGNLIVFNATFILFVEHVHSHFYSKLNESLLSNLQQLIPQLFFKDMPEVSGSILSLVSILFAFVLTHYHTLPYPKIKQREIKFKPRIKSGVVNRNIST